MSVSYTHLDVYKRQIADSSPLRKLIKRLTAGFVNLLNWQKQRPFQLIVDAFQLKRRIVQLAQLLG